jgi:hypothetical protein
MDDLRREIEHAVEEIAYAAVGFAVLGFQRAQVARRRLERCGPVASWTDQLRNVFSAASGTGSAPED